MAVHKPGVVYGLRDLPAAGYVRTISEKEIQVVMFQPATDVPFDVDLSVADGLSDVWPQVMEMSRKDARLLAKRINRCLDDTRGK